MSTISPAQLVANRANAQRSTGPRTDTGKAIASGNATRHGLLSTRLLLPGEDPEELDQLRAGLIADLQPEGDLEGVLVEHIVTLVWRLGRVATVEASVIGRQLWDDRYQHLRSGPTERLICASVPDSERAELEQAQAKRDAPEHALGGAFASLACGSDVLSKLGRYERKLERALYGARDAAGSAGAAPDYRADS